MKLPIPCSKCDKYTERIAISVELVISSISPLTVFVINCLYNSHYGTSIPFNSSKWLQRAHRSPYLWPALVLLTDTASRLSTTGKKKQSVRGNPPLLLLCPCPLWCFCRIIYNPNSSDFLPKQIRIYTKAYIILHQLKLLLNSRSIIAVISERGYYFLSRKSLKFALSSRKVYGREHRGRAGIRAGSFTSP